MTINLKAEWDRCSGTFGHEPRPEQWYEWTLQLLRGERALQTRIHHDIAERKS